MFLTFHRVDFLYSGSHEPIFTDLSFTLPRGWTGIIGANGAGKSTLLRVALGELQATCGHVQAPPGVYCSQRTDHAPEGLQTLLEAPYTEAQRLKRILGLQRDWATRWETLSHGERKRAQLGVALFLRPEVLAVDEPTNHLDGETRACVAQALAQFQGLGLLVSHDRELLDRLCEHCLFLEAQRAILRPGSYSQGAEAQAREALAQQREREKLDREVRGLRAELQTRREQTAKSERQRSKRGLAKHDHDAKTRIDAARCTDSGSGARLRQLEGRFRQSLEQRESLEVRRSFALGIQLPGEPSPKRHLLSIPESTLPLGPERSLVLPALVIHPEDRIGLSGPNGSGKSTLIRTILQHLEMAEDRLAYIPQEIDASRSRELLQAFKELNPEQRGQALSLVRRLGSDPARLLQSEEPSPGELRKLLLATRVQQVPQLIILDEPTNHMDLPTVICLEEALAECRAALILVSHDAPFLDRLTNRRWHIEKRADRCELRTET